MSMLQKETYMTKLQMKEIKLFEKEVKQIIKKQAKKHGFNVSSNCIYKRYNKYFTYSVFWIRCIENQFKLFFRMNIKLYNYDNLFWDIFDMKDNITAKDSLRANGAYTCPSIQWKEKSYDIKQFDSTEEDVDNAILDFQKEIDSFIINLNDNYGSFDSYVLSHTDILDQKLMEMLANISKQNYRAARDIAIIEVKNGNRGGYSNKGKDIFEYIIKYCEGELNM